ncbi:hypothetical protein BDR05DRAFT_136668 [Suillus weaverae]|nr:hypothetical protein BDR05DRAFT_136668 [Suillus weaverae]
MYDETLNYLNPSMRPLSPAPGIVVSPIVDHITSGWNYTLPAFPGVLLPRESQIRGLLAMQTYHLFERVIQVDRFGTGQNSGYKSKLSSHHPLQIHFGILYHISQIMRLSFVLAVVAAFKLMVSPVSADTGSPCPFFCNVTADCCFGDVCKAEIIDRGGTIWYLCEPGKSCFCFLIGAVWLTP